MSYRAAAEAAYTLAGDENTDVAKLGLRLLSDLADKECYSARLYMMYVHDLGGSSERDAELAQMWADRARAMHSTLSDADDLYDAGLKCRWDGHRFMATEHDALVFWERAASLGSGVALYAICDMTRHSQRGTSDWAGKLARAAALGSIEAMVELAEQDGVRGTEQEALWLRAATALGSVRATEMNDDTESQGKEWQETYDEILAILKRHGENNAFGEGDFWLVDDNWGGGIHKLYIANISVITRKLTSELMALLSAPKNLGWSIMVVLDVKSPSGEEIPPEGLIVHSSFVEEFWDKARLAAEFKDNFLWDQAITTEEETGQGAVVQQSRHQ